MIHTFIGDLGHLFTISAFATALFAAISYYFTTQSTEGAEKQYWTKTSRMFFFIHAFSIMGVVFCLFNIIYNHYFEYHYAWSHSSTRLPTHYMISCFWEGQEGSFLLWMFWHAILGLVLIFTNKYWESSMMTVFCLVQAFLASMILGVVIPGIDLKIGSSPFILLRDAIDAPIFTERPDFVPKDGTGLNPLLQNYWMVIHPPTLFLGFATTIVPFAYCIAGLWQKKYREWIRPALPWALFSGAILGLGILMGGYWAYETLNFGGYWNWDPVENAVYVPWLFLIASIHVMITFRNSDTALKASIVLVLLTFILILYSTFLTRSGILGESSVHSFTDLGLSGQLLLYLVFFTVGSIVLSFVRWSELPSSEKEASTYSREFWVFIGAIALCLMGFQVLVPTSIPVYNAIVEGLGGISNVAPPVDQIGYYTKFQLWFAIAIAFLSGTGQFFWWKKIDKDQLLQDLTVPLVITLIISAAVIAINQIGNVAYIILVLSGIYTVVANGKILFKIWKKNPNLSGGALSHIGVGLMLIGILFSSGYSRVVSMNNSALLISPTMSDEFNRENLLLFINQPKEMLDYKITYNGELLEPTEKSGLVRKSDVSKIDQFTAVAKTDIVFEDKKLYEAKDTFDIHGENTYYEVELKNKNGDSHFLYPRIQDNPQMGLAASPSIKRDFTKDIYAHVVTRQSKEDVKWSELKEYEVKPDENFFVNDYVASVDKLERIYTVNDVEIGEEDVAIKAFIKIQGENQDYLAQPLFLIKNGLIGRVPDELDDLGIQLTLINVHPETNSFTIGAKTRQKNWIILKAMEKPLINVLWIGTLILMTGFTIAISRRYSEFQKMKLKGME